MSLGEIKRREVVLTLKLDSHEEVRLPFVSPGEIKRREVVLTLKRARER